MCRWKLRGNLANTKSVGALDIKSLTKFILKGCESRLWPPGWITQPWNRIFAQPCTLLQRRFHNNRSSEKKKPQKFPTLFSTPSRLRLPFWLSEFSGTGVNRESGALPAARSVLFSANDSAVSKWLLKQHISATYHKFPVRCIRTEVCIIVMPVKV